MSHQSLSVSPNTLPANVRRGRYRLEAPPADLKKLMEQDLSIDRLEKISNYLWMVGRPYLPRSLSVQMNMGRIIVPTTDASLHLVWTGRRIFVKPLPVYMLSQDFFELHLKPPKPHNLALGFMHTWLALAPTELDFKLAQEAKVMDSGYDWSRWRALNQRILETYPDQEIYRTHPERYIYGELRLSRLDKIYRILHGDWLHGFTPLVGYTDYSDFFAENLALVAGTIVYIVVVLTAMQVGLAGDIVAKNDYFQRACYGFAVFSILSPIIAMALIFVIFIGIFIVNFLHTIAAKRERMRELKALRSSEHQRIKGEVQASYGPGDIVLYEQ